MNRILTAMFMIAVFSISSPAQEYHKRSDLSFWIAASSLATTTYLDIQSSKRLDRLYPGQFHEVNKLGSPAAQIAVSAGIVALGYWMHRKGGRRAWIGSALVTGAACSHTFGIIHNSRLMR